MLTPSRRTVLQWGAASLAATTLGSPLIRSAAAGPYDDAVFEPGPPPTPAQRTFTFAILPDTQNYSERYPDHYIAQTEWIVNNKDRYNIEAVLHLGDITNRNTDAEWKNAVEAMTRLDDVLPYFMALGNHDYSEGGVCKDRTTRFNQYFPLEKYRKAPTFGGVYDREPTKFENSYHLFSAGGRDFLVLCLEFGPRKDVVRWANEIVAKYPERLAILDTHAYMYFDETRYDWAKHGTKQAWNPHSYGVAKVTEDDVSDGEELWNGLVAKHESFLMTLNGHVLNDGLGRTVTATPGGRDVPQMLVNFQMKPSGGDGWLRLMEYAPDGTLTSHDYSPTLDKQNRSSQNHFTVKTAPLSV